MERNAILDEAIQAVQELKNSSGKMVCCGAGVDTYHGPAECCGDPDVLVDADLAIEAIESLKK